MNGPRLSTFLSFTAGVLATSGFAILALRLAPAFLAFLLLAFAWALLRRQPGGAQPLIFGFATGALLYIPFFLGREHALLTAATANDPRFLIFFGLLLAAIYFRKGALLLIVLLPLSVIYSFYTMLGVADGRILFGDDHAAFFYRLTQLKQHFPQIPYYNPLWNAGVEAREFFPSGMINLYLLFWPLFKLFAVEQVYTLVVALLLLVLAPLATYCASRLLGLQIPAAAAAGLLALAPSFTWLRWSLSYGTLGFITSVALLPLLLALYLRIIERRGASYLIGAAAVAVTTLTLLWPLALIFLVPLGCLLLRKLPQLCQARSFLVVAAAVLILNVPWMALFAEASGVGRFLQPVESTAAAASSGSAGELVRSGASGISLDLVLRVFAEQAESLSPAALLLAPAGLLLMPQLLARALLASTILWLVVVGTVLPGIQPRLELDRMLIVAGVLTCIPAGYAISRLLEFAERAILRAALAACLIAVACAAPIVLRDVLHGRSKIHVHFSSSFQDDLATQLRRYGGEGRVLFSGFLLHDIDHGHAAPLAYFARVPLVGSSYQHDRWEYQDAIPAHFSSRKYRGVEQFAEIYNASTLVAHEKLWRVFLKGRPELYELVWQRHRFAMFRRKKFVSNWFLHGSGELVLQEEGRVVIRPETPNGVIKFAHHPQLISSECVIFPVSIEHIGNFIGFSECIPGREVTITMRSPLRRLLGWK